MAGSWTAAITAINKSTTNANVLVTILYTSPDGTETHTEVYPGNDLTLDAIAAHAQTVCVAYATRDTTYAALQGSVGPITLPA